MAKYSTTWTTTREVEAFQMTEARMRVRDEWPDWLRAAYMERTFEYCCPECMRDDPKWMMNLWVCPWDRRLEPIYPDHWIIYENGRIEGACRPASFEATWEPLEEPAPVCDSREASDGS